MAIIDDFNREDASTLGANYSATGSQSLAIVSNQARHTGVGSTSSGNLRTAETYANDQYAIGTMVGKTANSYWTIYVRSDATTDNSYFVAWGGGGNDWYLNKKVGGSESTLVSGTRSWADGDTMEVRVTGTLIEFYHNGVLVDDATDSDHTSGDPGLEIYRDSAGSQGFDQFEAGDIGGGGPTAITGTGSMNLPVSPTVAGSGTVDTPGSPTAIFDVGGGVELTLPVTVTVDGSGTVQEPVTAITGSGALSIALNVTVQGQAPFPPSDGVGVRRGRFFSYIRSNF